MRIISGKYKGHRLVDFDAAHIRPTTDRVKETLFNKLMGQIEGARILDLFSGTGNLAIECLSRGADHVDLVEIHKHSLKIIRENLNKLKITEGYGLISRDAFAYLQTYKGPAYDLILADPPFTKALAHDLATTVGREAALRPEGWLVFEASAQERVDDAYPGLIRLDQRAFGDKHLHFFAKVNHAAESDLPR